MSWTDILKREATQEQWDNWIARQKTVHAWRGIKENVQAFTRETGMRAPPKILSLLHQEISSKKFKVKDIFNLDRSEKVEKTQRNDHRSDKEIMDHFKAMHDKYMVHAVRDTPPYKTGVQGLVSQKHTDYQEMMASILKELGRAASDYSRMITDDLSDSSRRTANDANRRFRAGPRTPTPSSHRGKER